MLGHHVPGTSPLHRLPAGWKFLGLLVFGALTLLVRAPLVLGGIALGVALAYALARIPARRCWHAVRFPVPMLAFVFLVQWWLLDLDRAAEISLRLFAALAAANLFTLTTQVEDLVDAVERGLRPAKRIGLRPDRVGLLVGLTMQAVARLSMVLTETREAQRARGATRSARAFAVPVLVRTLRHADELGEALAARGIADD